MTHMRRKIREYVNSKYITKVERYDWDGTTGSTVHYVYLYIIGREVDNEPLLIGHGYTDEQEADNKFAEIEMAILSGESKLILIG